MTTRPYIPVMLLAAFLAGCSSGRIPPQEHMVENIALISRTVDEVAGLVETYLTRKGLALQKENLMRAPGRRTTIITAASDMRVTHRSVALPDVPPLFLPDTLGCDCGSMPEDILIEKIGYYDNFTIVRTISIEEFDSATSMVTLDFRYNASYFRPGGYFDSKVTCRSIGAREAELFAYLVKPEEKE